jgi:hypothetical protein
MQPNGIKAVDPMDGKSVDLNFEIEQNKATAK